MSFSKEKRIMQSKFPCREKVGIIKFTMYTEEPFGKVLEENHSYAHNSYVYLNCLLTLIMC